MRKLILQMQVSVDGYVGRKGGGPDWQVWDWGKYCPWDKPLRDRFNRFFADADTILLSRKIVETGYLDHWREMAKLYPEQPEFAFAKRIGEMRKVIFSKTLTEAPWPGTELADESLEDEVGTLKAQKGKNIVAFGGAGFASSLVGAGIVDAMEFYINPVALGDGLSIFPAMPAGTALSLKCADAYDSEIVVNTYVNPRSGTGIKRLRHAT